MAFLLKFNGKALFFLYKKNFDRALPSKFIYIINCHSLIRILSTVFGNIRKSNKKK